jgi:hypothetical protein
LAQLPRGFGLLIDNRLHVFAIHVTLTTIVARLLQVAGPN